MFQVFFAARSVLLPFGFSADGGISWTSLVVVVLIFVHYQTVSIFEGFKNDLYGDFGLHPD